MFGANPSVERNLLMEQCLQAAADKIGRLEGPDPTKWSWGRLHIMQFRHSLDRAPGAGLLTDPKPIPRSGDGETVGASGYYGDSFEQVEGASYREIMDLSNWDKSVAVNTPGQSGQPGSAHYSDLLSPWSEGRYFPLLYSQDVVEKQSKDKLVLQP